MSDYGEDDTVLNLKPMSDQRFLKMLNKLMTLYTLIIGEQEILDSISKNFKVK